MKYQTDLSSGLIDGQIKIRKKQKLVNYNSDVPTKSIGQIIITNTFTLFNLLNLSLAFLIFLVGSYKNLLFLGVVICNTLISIIQEIRAKKEIDKLSLISQNKANVLRGAENRCINIDEIVLDDIISFKIGDQVVVDSIIRKGSVEVNESFITGESNSHLKSSGDILLSGSFITSGRCLAQVTSVGENNYTSKISMGAKYVKKVNSLLLNSLNKIIKIVSIIIIPLGILLFINQFFIVKSGFNSAIINIVAALIAMIPEGLVLLTSTVLAVSVIRLSKKNVLVGQLYCLESLARADVLCFDKTGTLTEGKMEVKRFVSLSNNKYNVKEIMGEICGAFDADNETMSAIKRYYSSSNKYEIEEKIPFSSDRKYSKVKFEGLGTYLLGAPEFILKDKIDNYDFDKYNEEGRLVLLACEKYKDVYPIGLIIIEDKIRESATKAIEYFKKQDIDIKIISGDNPITVLNVAKQLNLDIKSYIDTSSITEKKLLDNIDKYSIFGRVTPHLKKLLIQKLKSNGHTVAMIGDGVNDVLALKEADCSIALNSGSSAARNVSELVLLDSNFNSMNDIVSEGRRTINNIERSASLFIVKTIYACLLALIFILIPMAYPFQPIQLTLTSAFTIGIPSFILALEPNEDRIKNNFFINIFAAAIPTALAIVINILLVLIIGNIFKISSNEISTLAVIMTGFTGFLHLYRISKPLNKLRLALLITLITFFTLGIVGLRNLFSLTILNIKMFIIIIGLILFTLVLLKLLVILFDKYIYKYIKKISEK